MADSVSKMVTPSEIFGIPMGVASRNTPPIQGSLNKNVSKDKSESESTSASSVSKRKSITSVEQVTSLSDLNGESVSWNRLGEGHGECMKSLTSAGHRQETVKQNQQEPFYYILARTGGKSDNIINTNDSIPVMLMGKQGQANSIQTIAFSMTSTPHLQSSTLNKEKVQKLPQKMLPQVVAVVPNLPQSAEHTDDAPGYHRDQQQLPNLIATRGQTSLDPQWLKTLANLLHLHVTNNDTQLQEDAPDSRLISDEQLISSLTSSSDTSIMGGFPSSGCRNGLVSNPHTEKYTASTVGAAPRSALAQIQPLCMTTSAAENLNSKETQTLPRVQPQYTTKRQLVFVSPLMTQPDAKPKLGVFSGDGENFKNCTSSPPGKESDLSNCTSIDDNSMDTSDQISQEINDRDDTCKSECTPSDYIQKKSQYPKGHFKATPSKTIRSGIKNSESVLSLHSMNNNIGSQCTMKTKKKNSEDELPRNTTSTIATVKSPTFSASPILNVEDARTVREKHNLKERKRRARIKEACDLMRQIVPGMSKKTDKATVFEFSARYIHFLKSQLGNGKDKVKRKKMLTECAIA